MFSRVIERCGALFEKRSLLVLFTLMLLSGLALGLVPVAYVYLMKRVQTLEPIGPALASRGGMTSAIAGRCNQVLIRFASSAPIGSVGRLMDQVDASIVFGPDQDGAFELSVPAERVDAIVFNLNASDLVVVASRQPSCR